MELEWLVRQNAVLACGFATAREYSSLYDDPTTRRDDRPHSGTAGQASSGTRRAEIERQRRENPGTRHVTITPTPEQAEQHRRAVEEEEAARDANSAYAPKLLAALEEPGFSGDLRRAIVASRREHDDLARTLGIDASLLEDFLDGDASLPTAVVDRLVVVLGLRLTAISR